MTRTTPWLACLLVSAAGCQQSAMSDPNPFRCDRGCAGPSADDARDASARDPSDAGHPPLPLPPPPPPLPGVLPRGECTLTLATSARRVGRRADLADDLVLSAPDLLATRVPADRTGCDARLLRVCARVIDMGDAFIGAGVEVTFFDGDPEAGGVAIDSVRTTIPLMPRFGGEVVCADWTDAPLTPRPIYAKVDAHDQARECVETNNVTLLGNLSCAVIL